ncbi:MAG TPA: HD domain-containing phosphohydrolase [Blastocatellia bacterium]|jgi:putative nucleotidyltransferase with HDIG domain
MKLALRKLMHNLGSLSELGAEITSTHDFEEIVRTSLHTILGTLAIPKGAIAEYSARPREARIIAAKGISSVVGETIALGRDEAERFRSRSRPIRVKSERNGFSRFIRRNDELFHRLHACQVVPMVTRGQFMGMIFLSEKFSRADYDDEDLAIIETIARHIGIAIYNHRLLLRLRSKAEDNRRLYREMRQLYHDTVKAFGAAIDLKDSYTSGHSHRVAKYAEAIAREMGLIGAELEHVAVAAYLHDIGKIVVERAIINNPRPLTEREYRELNRHVTTGYEILSHIRQPWKEIAYLTKCHHERVDGKGYPQGLSGEDIPLGSKIVTLADSFDAMMTDRPYRARLPLEQALADLRHQADKQFDTRVVAAFCRLLLDEIRGFARQRTLLTMIGLNFDRETVVEMLDSIIAEFDQSGAQPS